jgi:hypothetical protein
MAADPFTFDSDAGILPIIQRLEAEGYKGQFAAKAGGRIRCLTCGQERMAEAYEDARLVRVDVETDPDGQSVIAALTCPTCHAAGTLTVSYGPSSSQDDGEVLRRLNPSAHGSAP